MRPRGAPQQGAQAQGPRPRWKPVIQPAASVALEQTRFVLEAALSTSAPATTPQPGQPASTNTPRVYALGGEIVSTSAQARRILIQAIRDDREYLAAQAESVMRLLRAEGQ